MSEHSIGFSICKNRTMTITVEPTKAIKYVKGKNCILKAVVLLL